MPPKKEKALPKEEQRIKVETRQVRPPAAEGAGEAAAAGGQRPESEDERRRVQQQIDQRANQPLPEAHPVLEPAPAPAAAPIQMAAPKIPMPTFSGEKGTFARFIRNFEAWCEGTAVAEDRRYMLLSHSIKEKTKAATWYEAYDGAHTRPQMENWTHVKRDMAARFDHVHTPGELTALVDALKQGTEEDVETFADRIAQCMLQVCRDMQTYAGATAAHQREIEASVRNHFARLYFLQGLKEELRKLVSAGTATTFEEYVAAARRAETTVKDLRQENTGITVFSAQLENQEGTFQAAEAAIRQEAENRIEAMRVAGGMGRGAFRGRGGAWRGPATWRGGFRGGAPNRGGFNRGTGPPGPRGGPRGGAAGRGGRGALSHLPADMCARCGMCGHHQRTCWVQEKNFKWGQNGYEQPPQVFEIHQPGAAQMAPQGENVQSNDNQVGGGENLADQNFQNFQ